MVIQLLSLQRSWGSSKKPKIFNQIYRYIYSSPYLLQYDDSTIADTTRRKVLDSFKRQTFMSTLGAKITHIGVGEVDIELRSRPHLLQQNGYIHAGVSTSIGDSAAGYAALTCFPTSHEIDGVLEESDVLTTEFKVNLLNPAVGNILVARGRVVKSGRTLTIAKTDVYAKQNDDENGGNSDRKSNEVHVLTGLFTLFQTKVKFRLPNGDQNR